MVTLARSTDLSGVAAMARETSSVDTGSGMVPFSR